MFKTQKFKTMQGLTLTVIESAGCQVRDIQANMTIKHKWYLGLHELIYCSGISSFLQCKLFY